jgi:hypothetical protein
MAQNARFYASLIGPLLGVYYPLPFTSQVQNRIALSTSRLKDLWCSVYPDFEVDLQIKQFGGLKLPETFAQWLDYDSDAVDRWQQGKQV